MQNKILAFLTVLSFLTFSTNILAENSIIDELGFLTSEKYEADQSTTSIESINQKYGVPTALTGNTAQLENFFRELKNSKNKVIRIAHFGDSLIWGDIISADLREFFQKKFGGLGAGMQNFCADDITIKTSTAHTFSSDWKWSSLFTRNESRLPIGIGASVSIPSNKSWVEYKGNRDFFSSRSFNKVKVYYSNLKSPVSLDYATNTNLSGTLALKPTEALTQSVINLENESNSIKMTFNSNPDGYFYTTSLESGAGVYVDNFPIRGNNGVTLSNIDEQHLKDLKKYEDYKLFILNFGINAMEAGKTDYRWYINKMVKSIEYLKGIFPDAGFIVVSAGDRAIKRGSKLVSDPDLDALLKAQEVIAKRADVAFWNMKDAMGGDNSMIEWVEARPSLGLRDYVHLTSDGGKLIAQLLFDAIMLKYNEIN